MAELKRKEGQLTMADLATYGIRPKQLDGPTLVKGGPELWMRLQSQLPHPCFLNRRWAISDRSGASYKPVSWTSRAGQSKMQTNW
jgi:hypothetical protein